MPTLRKDWVILAALLAVVAGCQEDEIRRYQVPRVENPAPAAPKQRLLGAIIPYKEQVWFFKMMGPAPAVTQQQEAFTAFVRSVRFQDDPKQPLAWTAPESWQQGPAAPQRYATFKIGDQDAPLELTVSPLPRRGQAASVLDNVNRWRGQIGLKSIRESQLKSVCTTEKVGGVEATLVDMTGPE